MSPHAHATLRRLVLTLLLLLGGCATHPAIDESDRLIAQGHTEEGVLRLAQAVQENPDDHQLQGRYLRQRERLLGQLSEAAASEREAGRIDAAEALYQRMLKLDANNQRARNGLTEVAMERRHQAALAEVRVLMAQNDTAAAERILRTLVAENPLNSEAKRLLQDVRRKAQQSEEPLRRALKSPFTAPISLEFHDAEMKTVFEMISRSAGINFVFDKDVKSQTKVTLFVRDTSIDEVVRLILATNQLERKMLNENSVLIYPNTPAKAKEYQELVTRSFYLANAEVKQAQALVKTLVKSKDIFVDEKLNLLVIKDTPEAVRMAERLLESLDIAEPEVMLELEVMEMTRSKLRELGLRYPDRIGYGLLRNPNIVLQPTQGVGGQVVPEAGAEVAPGVVDLSNADELTAYVTNPALVLNLRNEAGDGSLLANPRIRVKNRSRAKIHIGDKLPVFTTTSTANVGVSSSVSYLDVGLKLDIEPNVYLDDEVSMKVDLEVSSVVKEVPGPAGSLAYQIGSRTAGTVLRLKNGETQVLAGLISDEERSSANRLPGLGDIPVVGRLFSNQRDSGSKTEIILLITPRVVRNLALPEGATAVNAAGSEAAVGAPALRVNQTGLHGLSLSSQPAGGSAVVSPPLSEQPAEPVETPELPLPPPAPEPPSLPPEPAAMPALPLPAAGAPPLPASQ
ncbi:MAG TPA: secretin and TonB N-terminal domain-containing protein [Pseudomonadales bacterium]|jgi:general secretion pathway protein D|nr:secretin and TonB N-terminal domain-containing protein [Pseudomonadales bacterium]HNN65257.1 secretin and TonB N-terminal domain-containing protein [Pseudomonadales bacterium]HNV53914.1 secretin and TonB N-terminal domain-containing protein [Pseudomonadales bacterium]